MYEEGKTTGRYFDLQKGKRAQVKDCTREMWRFSGTSPQACEEEEESAQMAGYVANGFTRTRRQD